MGVLSRVYWTLAAAGAAYVLGMLSLTHPTIQRAVTYANFVNPTYWQNLTDVENFGFFKSQVQAFTVQTPDEQTIYAWHVLPLHLYKTNEAALGSHVPVAEDWSIASRRLNLRLLLEDPNAVLVIFFHGNAGHLASAHRGPTYQNFLSLSTPDRPVHVIGFDYRGFGLSTGSPTEEGVTIDAITLLSHLTGHDMPVSVTDSTNAALQSLHTSNNTISPDRVVLVGQSMGTFVSTAAYHAWTMQLQRPAPRALVLFAGFTSLPKLLDTYSIKGLTPPLLSPLIAWPFVQTWFLGKVADKWDTKQRLVDLVRTPDVPLDLTILHAKNDWEIMWGNGRGNWEAILDAVGEREVYTKKIEDGEMSWSSLKYDDGGDVGKKVVRWQLLEKGGHNRLTSSEQGKLAVWGAIDGWKDR